MRSPANDALPLTAALRDWNRAFCMWRLWTALGMEDLSDRYRRTLLGIFWVAASFAAFVFIKVLVFQQMASVPVAEFALYVTIGFGLWTFISSMVIDGCLVYTGSRGWILGSNIPYPVFFLQCIYRNLLVFGMILVVVAASVAWHKEEWSPVMLAAIPALVVYVVTSLWLVAIFAPLCARYRDLLHLMQTIMRLMFFATPIIWMTPRAGVLAIVAKYNVATHFIEIVRKPLIYDTVPYDSWMVVVAVNAVGLLVGYLSYALTRNRIAYWL
jgi:ABC-type polysaccharide/polyol phosphate export permease